MKALEKVYWLRIALGMVAALLCTGYGIATNRITSDPSNFPPTTLLNGVSIALVTYLISYYIIKGKFMHKLEKPQKLFTTGIGIYFLSWLVFWIFLYTIIAGLPPAPPPG